MKLPRTRNSGPFGPSWLTRLGRSERARGSLKAIWDLNALSRRSWIVKGCLGPLYVFSVISNPKRAVLPRNESPEARERLASSLAQSILRAPRFVKCKNAVRRMTNDEVPNDERNPNDEIPNPQASARGRSSPRRISPQHGFFGCLPRNRVTTRRDDYGHSDFDIRASFGLGYFVIRHSAMVRLRRIPAMLR